MERTITKTINIKATPQKVWEYVNDLSRWAEWGIVNVHKVHRGENGYWLMDGPRGTSKVKMHSDKKSGILDHEFIDPQEGRWAVSCRVVPGGEGSHFMITFTKPDAMPDEAFEQGMKAFEAEAGKLKEVMERQ